MASQARSKAEVIQLVDEEWSRLLEVAQGVPEEEQILGGAAGHWSVKDVLGHIATWEDELVKVVERFQRSGEETSYGGEGAIDRFNQAEVEKKRGLPVGQVWDELRQSHQRLLQFLRELPEEAFTPDTYTGEWVTLDSWGHYREHREDLERWKASRR